MGLLHGVQSPTLRITQQIPLLQEDSPTPRKKSKEDNLEKAEEIKQARANHIGI